MQEVFIVKRRVGIPNSTDIAVYMEHDGYKALRKAVTEMAPEEVIEVVKASGLRGCELERLLKEEGWRPLQQSLEGFPEQW